MAKLEAYEVSVLASLFSLAEVSRPKVPGSVSRWLGLSLASLSSWDARV